MDGSHPILGVVPAVPRQVRLEEDTVHQIERLLARLVAALASAGTVPSAVRDKVREALSGALQRPADS